MFRKLLGLIFNAWTLLALLVLVLLALIWWVGPLVAIGELRPLDGTTARWITTLVMLALLAAALVWRAWRARRRNGEVVEQLVAAPAEDADLGAVRGRFEDALRLLSQARFGAGGPEGRPGAWRRLGQRLSGRYLYELPWYLIIGAPGTGKTTALRNAGLRFPLASELGEDAVRGVGGTRNCDWWFTDQAVLIDTAGRFTTQDSDATRDKATWNGFLALLKRSRPRQPLNGVMVTVAVPDLVSRPADERRWLAATVRARLQELHEQLGLRLPIYLLVTKSDLMAGFAESFAALDKVQRSEPWGFSFAPGDKAWQQTLPQELDALQQRLDQGLVDLLAAEPDPVRRVRIYGFPNQFAALKQPLTEFVQQVFAPSPYEAEPMLRGAYFVSGTQEGSPIDRVLGAVARRFNLQHAMLPPQRSSGRSFFLEQLLTRVVFAEQGLAGTNREWSRRRDVLVLGAYAGLGLLTAGLLAGWWTSWRGNRDYIATVAQRVETVRQLVNQTPKRASTELLPLLPALDATLQLARPQPEADAPWSLGFGLFQGRRLDGAARSAYEQMLRDAVTPRLALRFEELLRADGHADAQYEALKAYLMSYEVEHFDAPALKAEVESDWDVQLGRGLAPGQREALSRHLDALLAQGPIVSPLPRDAALIEATRKRLAAMPLPQRVYARLRQRGLDEAFPEFTVARAAGPNAALVFTRQSGEPLTRGVPGLFTYKGYHEGFERQVGAASRQLAQEQQWVLAGAATEARGPALLADDKLVTDVRRLYLTDYRDTWRAFIADVRLLPVDGVSQALERTRFLAAADSPLLPLMRAMARETTLLAGQGVIENAERRAGGTLEAIKSRVLGTVGARPTQGAPGERLESIVDDEFAQLRRSVTAPEGGKSPLENTVARLGELQVQLQAAEAALKGGSPPPPSALPNQLRAEATQSPEPVRSLLNDLGAASASGAASQLRASLAREVRSQVGEFCNQAASGRYPFDATASREMTPQDFMSLFGPGGRFEQMQQKLAPYIDTTTRPWSFRALDGVALGHDSGTLPQFQRAAVIRETYFVGGSGPSTQLVLKPLEMDPGLKEFVLDVDGQIVRYDHGPQIPQTLKWPGPRGSGVVRVMVQPAGTGIVKDGPWALFRLFEQVSLQPGASPEKFRASFDIDGRKIVFDVTAGSVRNPFKLPELRGFSCPNGL
ncbi:type VI secretion system membrane subunit TssM [Rubrivivax gelatinosus]|nr:type VI secretion system membrane subunit TssM [Rubrivivax gelatinosus]